MDEPRNLLSSSGPATPRKGETHDWGRKMMITIVWNPQGFNLVNALPKGQKFNANYYIERIRQPFLENRLTGRGPGLIIHADNARPHTAEKRSKFAGKMT
jgi:hypothetical protein